jgi:hypothetical protein
MVGKARRRAIVERPPVVLKLLLAEQATPRLNTSMIAGVSVTELPKAAGSGSLSARDRLVDMGDVERGWKFARAWLLYELNGQ